MQPTEAELLQAILEGSLAALMVLNSEGRILEINRAALRFIRMDRESALGKVLWELFPWNSSGLAAMDLQRAVRGAAQGEIASHLLSDHCFSFTLNRVSAPAGGFWLTLEAHDVAELAQARLDAERNRQHSEFSFGAARMGSWIWDMARDTVTSYPGVTPLFGLPYLNDTPRTQALAAVHPSDRERLETEIQDAIARRSDLRTEARLVLEDGSTKWVALMGAVRRDEQGAPLRMYGITLDITERKETELRLRESEARFRTIFENAGIAVTILAPDGRVIEANPAQEHILGYTSEELQTMVFTEYTDPDHVASDLALFEELLAGRLDRIEIERQYRHKKGHLIWGRVVASVVRDAAGQPQFVITLGEDVTERKKTEADLLALSEKLIHTQEQERTRIARELHDDLGQQIAALSVSVSNLARQIPESQPELGAQSRRLHQRIAAVAESVRRLSHELHPAVLEHSGITAALRSYCTQFSAATAVHVSVDAIDSFEDVPPQVALCLYRVAQEALQNAARHSGSKAANLELSRSTGRIRLTISDSGVGFAPAHPAARAGLGLISMKERVRLVNGTLHVESSPGTGTRVTALIPV